jgi:hypothetical protein
MKLCIQRLTRSIWLLAIATIAACGGGNESVDMPSIPAIKASVPVPAKKAATVTGPSGVVIGMYQALYGMAPSNAMLLDYTAQATADTSAFAQQLTSNFNSTNHAVLAKQVLDNLGVTATTVPAINAKGESEYSILLDAVQQVFGVYPTMRGQVILNMTNLLAVLESDATYGATAVEYKNQALTNYNYSTNSLNVTAKIQSAIGPYSSQALNLPDLRAKYDSLCGNDVGVQSAIAANLSAHRDRKKDLIFTLWCAMRPFGQTSTAPTKNGLVVFLQQSDGTFIDGTKKLFGVELLDIGGVGSSPVAYDFNNDGYDDIVYPVSGEDGRALPVGYSGNNRQNFFIISKGDGTYSTAQLGTPSYGFSGKLVDNQYNSKDALISTIGYGGTEQAWRFVGGTWNAVRDYDLMGSYIGLFFSATAPNHGTDKAIIAKSSTSIDLYSKSMANKWSLTSTWAFPDVRTADLKSWNGDPGKLSVVGINGTDYTFIYFGDGCEIKRKPSESPIAIFALPASEVVGGFNGQLLVESSSQLKSHLILQGFSTENGILTKIDIPIKNEITDQPYFRLSCGDLNSDGIDDIMVMPWGKGVSPIIYLNDGFGNFQAINQGVFPITASEFTDVTMIYADIDGDGILDLIYWPLNGLHNNPSKVQYQIFKGVRNLRQGDLK